MRLELFFTLIVLCFIYISYVDGLKANDTGVCVVTRSVKKTQRRVFIVKYKCGRKICTTRRSKIKENIVTQNDTLCCKGWTYSSESDACNPLCSRGCIGGRCTAPDICQCDPPSILDQDQKNVCYLPKCNPPCINGQCIANDTCTCSDGYENVDNTCRPKCDECQNGRCISPNNCECFEGFIKQNGTCSRPVCKPICINGICKENNTCICHHGYEKINTSNICQPKCDKCQNGRCISPNKCECFEGYTKRDGVCSLPLCQPVCVNGLCRENNILCTCLDGYKKVNNTCQPKCEKCQNGRCISPNNCECFEGYAKSDGVCKPLCRDVTSNECRCVTYKNNITSCFKSCQEDCVVCDHRGQCRKNECGSGKIEVVCCENYIWDYDKKTKSEFCKPICRPSCGKHGECVKYNTCKCKPPYEFRENTCLPPISCDTPCVNGKCTGYNTCSCDTGYKATNASHCKAECKQTCINSICTAPDRCECFHGYSRKSQWECTPTCNGCENGKCTGPNICECNEGYFRQGDICVPICEGNCLHGQCVKPGECRCDSGYENHNKLTCRPKCELGCINATCDSPNRCSCLPGYTRINGTACKPKCVACSNGDCIGPNECRCHRGYAMVGIKCKPLCSNTCVNGFCSEPDKCTCLGGYVSDDNDKFVCKPECGTCENGVCTSPGLCTCNEGFERINGTCKPSCSQDCVNGYCQAPNQCGCPDGYKLRTTPKSSFCYVNSNETIDCNSCEGNCTDSDTVCSCPDGRTCEMITEASRTGLAGLELTWILGACIGLLLFILVIAIMAQMWRKRPNVKATYAEGNANGSVVFTAPGTLTSRIFTDNTVDEDLYNSVGGKYEDETDDQQTADRLLRGEVVYEDEKL